MCVVSNTADQGTKLAITDTKLYVLVVPSPIQEMQNYWNSWDQVLKDQLTGWNINQK